MKRKDAIKWIKALRSGKYKQTQEVLKDNTGYCCLGVLNELFPKLNLAGGSHCSLRNYKVIGLGGYEGKLIVPDTGEFVGNLAGLNDGSFIDEFNVRLKLNFQEIADIIQIEYVDGL